MEVTIDWVIKMGFRNDWFRTWMVNNVQSWTYMIEWLKENNEPPQSFMGYGHVQNNSAVKLCKRSRESTTS